MKKGIILFIFLCSIASISAANLYRWQDASGQWHFSDRPPMGQQLTPVDSQEIAAVKWQTTPKIKPLPKQFAPKGRGFKTQNASLCEKLRRSFRIAEKKAEDNLWDYDSREEKRRYRWEIQKSC